MTRAAVETIRFTRAFHGQADQVSHARHEVARHLLACGCPRIDDAVLVHAAFHQSPGSCSAQPGRGAVVG